MSANYDAVSNFLLNQTPIFYQIRQNKRVRGLRLCITPEQELLIESRRVVSQERAERLLISKQQWVLANLKRAQKKLATITTIKKHPQSVLLFGIEKQIIIKLNEPRDYCLESAQTVTMGFANGSQDKTLAQETLNQWFRARATLYLPLRVRHLAKQTFDVAAVTIKDQKSLWGSCTRAHRISLSWRLVMAPVFASDYIIWHELCHTRCLNHSKQFWALVREVCPEYKQAETWFRKYGFVLHRDCVAF